MGVRCQAMVRLQAAVLVLWGAAACRDSAHLNCTDLVRERGCDYCCLAPDTRQSVRTACPASCGLCAAPTSGPSYEAEQRVLVGLYRATAGAAWTNRERWLDTNGSHCFWFGVNCAEDGEVARIDLHANSLSGTVPAELASLTQLTQLGLYTNSLSGTVPVQLASLTGLTHLNLFINSLSGTLPAALSSLTELAGLGLFTNSLSGTIPLVLTGLASLTGLDLYENRVSGTVPARLLNLIRLSYLDLGRNRLSGTVPGGLSSLSQLTNLYLSNDRFSGTLPGGLARLTRLIVLDVQTNMLSGTVPLELASLTRVTELGLDTNSLSGTVPVELTGLTRLADLNLHTNSLSGTVHRELASLTVLTGLGLYRNRLSGTVPVELTSLNKLAVLNLASNAISGDLPESLPTSLEQLVLHHNSLSGPLPSFVDLSSLRVLTLFDNNLRGRLKLPRTAPHLQVLAVHQNRLSCPVEYNASSYNLSNHGLEYQHGALIAPGNRLSSAGKPSWALTSEVTFQWVPESQWQEWQLEICFAAIGLLGTLLAVGVLLKSEWRSYFWFQPQGSYEQLALLCVRLMFGLSLIGLVCLMPVYVMGAGEFECGQPWLRSTLAYLKGSRSSELAAAVLLCVLLGVQAFMVFGLRSWLRAIRTDQTDLPFVVKLSWQRRLVIAVVWPLTVLIFSVPGFLATLAKSVPGDQNTLGLSQSVLDYADYAISPLLAFIDSVLVPTSVRWLAGQHGTRTTVGLALAARFLILFAAPFTTALLLGSDCLGMWITVWKPCQDAGHFNMKYVAEQTTTNTTGTTATVTSFFFATTTTVTQHSEVCDTQSLAYGRCPRFVLEALADLVVAKQIFSVFVSPLITVLLSLPWVVAARRWAMRVLLRMEYTRTLDRDLELVLLSMVLDEAFVLGLAVPVVLPLGCLVVASRLAAVHLVTNRLGVQFERGHRATPAWWYFSISVLLGASLLLWFFISNAALISGELIVYLGAPIGLLAGAGGSWAWHWRGGANGVSEILLQPADDNDYKGDYSLFEESLERATVYTKTAVMRILVPEPKDEPQTN